MNNPCARLREALNAMQVLGKIEQVSSFYETEPMEVKEQPWFVNCSLKLCTVLEAEMLMKALLAIERKMGRIRARSKGPRVIDIDLLLYNEDVIDRHGLRVPHPAMAQRRFVLAPLAEIAPDAWHPGLNKTVSELFSALGESAGAVRKLDASIQNASGTHSPPVFQKR